MYKSPLNPELRIRLEKLATECRHLLEQAKPRLRHLPSLADFPLGACGDASLVLAWYLRQHGLTELIAYVCSNEIPSHAWLEVEGWLVDITADQFSSGHPPIWVLPAAQSKFHQEYHPVKHRNADFDKQDAQTQSSISQALACLNPQK